MPLDKEQERVNHIINAGIRADKRRNERILKLLLLGGSEHSGKDSIIHQIRIIHDPSYTEERSYYRPLIYDFCFSSICFLSVAAHQALELRMRTENQGASERLCEERKRQKEGSVDLLTPEHARDIMALWHDPAIQHAYRHNPNLRLHDSIPYFFSRIEDLAKPNYIPSAQDVLHIQSDSSRGRIREISMNAQGTDVQLIDINRQRNDNIKKWIYFFEHVTMLVYCVSVKEFMSKDMPESLELFDDLCNSYFRGTGIIILLYKDIPDISRESTQQIFNRFLAVNRVADSMIYTYEVTEADTNILNLVLQAVNNSILTAALAESEKNWWYTVCCFLCCCGCCCCCCT